MAPVLRNISDTARWTAAYRARETARSDALFRDPLAARLAGERGESIRRQMAAGGADNEWAFLVRTHLFDRAIQGRVAAGVRTVVNLAAGLDARPYRMELPAGLEWVEIDLPEIVVDKEEALAGEPARCRLERVALDLSDRAARRDALGRFPGGLAITEGLLVYLSDEQVAELGRDLAAAELDYWLLDLGSPALVKMVQATIGRLTAAAGAPLRFGPREGVAFFEPLGWKPASVEGVFEAAMKLGRVPQELLAAPPPPPGPDGPIWSGVVLLERSARAGGESGEGRG
jgi:methyltransferase (TIGR00027 family)